ncbi:MULTISPECIES: phage portal protein [unclassified Vibrio]|uniref:phage portal protein n=1 Tax=unclassified Vibrio TaxID=2614977 RepID=UPI001361A39B|nr:MULTISPECIES: phage portal protein [unclassified Vibrio]NAW58485.1 phage portal protein [Vibrio sp. V36_P2S2PM302]NAX24957.1 phage portal protein [Vibrio sp. V38_P2S17PM301]NAX32557.1 phage portal protein [Vibrio sp. V37_P2S8PM304]
MQNTTITAQMDEASVNAIKRHEREDATVFTFGGVERVDVVNPAHYDGVEYDAFEQYYSPPIEPNALSDMMIANSYHGSIVEARARILAKDYHVIDLMPFTDMMNMAKDLVGFGQCYYQVFYNFLNQPVRLAHVPAQPIRKSKNNRFVRLNSDETKTWFKAGELFHVKLYDPKQNVYGLPDYLSGLQSAMLAEDATLFRRRYYKNGAHMGFILYTTDPNMTPAVEEELQDALKNSRGVGNFKSLLINIPNGQEKGVQLIPVGDVSTKDEFPTIKTVSSQDVMVAHRFPPGLSGIIPAQGSAMGDPEKYNRTYYENEVKPMQKLLASVNQILPKTKQIRFDVPAFLAS